MINQHALSSEKRSDTADVVRSYDNNKLTIFILFNSKKGRTYSKELTKFWILPLFVYI